MIIGINHVVIYTKDLDQAKKFYCEILNFQIGYSDEVWTEVHLPNKGAYIGLHKTEEPIQKGSEITFRVNNIEQVYNDLNQKGVKFIGEIFSPAKGIKLIHFEDPDGNPLSLIEYGETEH